MKKKYTLLLTQKVNRSRGNNSDPCLIPQTLRIYQIDSKMIARNAFKCQNSVPNEELKLYREQKHIEIHS